jgi:hypothetical protein
LTLFEDFPEGRAALTPGQSLIQPLTSGIAEFVFAVANPGFYHLEATVVAYGACANTFVGPFTTQTFEVTGSPTSITETCPPTETCITPPITSVGGSIATIQATGGATIIASFSTLFDAHFTACKSTTPSDLTGVLNIVVTGSTKTIITLVVAGNAPLPVCWHSPFPFKQADGKLAKADTDGYTGLLPACKSKTPVGPCILSQSPQGPKPITHTTIKILDSNCAGCSGGYISRK